ncbi:PTS fructose transporter subunit IIABC [Streptomyces albireticuli]|uniref:PTS lactose transporter subunit IIC n=1 Tax=Streptomyces albireticuli TaxID=1940 RepID=A0A2A2D8D0_9ACTN|nr:fructose-specific PTS transporter subunit EIIC [Streptomyces albireticuli]MCD9144422.1 fructose-specific PTS transporter subunit EIIC [Streptomyces albireticuli]MCD9163515.1 fructose-specific PTS transporter subunit EIIC [Streptomyces albireticuli]MCD9193099.1 fructose-specific PTS transporter subunit EIIC [Streptomyces albireticuli]PAU47775.1 PTS lactose transporter subunit IIC [Streptomyces albireticuli]
MSELITAALVDLDLAAETKEAAARSLAERMRELGRVTDLDGFLADVAAREAQMPTGLDGGIGIPHCRSAHVTEPTLAFGRSAARVDFGAPDGPADLVFLIAAPAGADSDHLTILSGLARRLMVPEFTEALRSAGDAGRVAALIRGDEAEEAGEEAESEGPTAEPKTTSSAPEKSSSAPRTASPEPEEAPPTPFHIVAVTSCPTGIAHTYMAAQALERAARDAGVELVVETQGSAGFVALDAEVIARADGVILAHDVEVRDRARFAGKPVVDVGVKAGVSRAAELIAEVRAKAARGTTGPAPEPSASPQASPPAPMDAGAEAGDGFATRLRTWLMTGVSYMVPFVAAGGLLIALAFAVGGYEVNKAPSVAGHFVWTESASWAALLFQTGGAAFGFLVPVLAGYIAYGMADRPGLVPGFVGGAIALTVNAGFLGGLIAGLLAGGAVLAVQRLDVPPVLRGIMPVVVIPLLSSAVVGFLMFLVVGKPVASLQKALTDWLAGLSGANAVVLGVLLGLMMCFDLGGPLNKCAYAFAVGGLAHPNDGSLKVMAAVMAAGMVPPLALALATTVRGRLFTAAERENGKAAWVLGASFITEGAIPFAAADPLRVIPSAMAGGAVTGALSMAFGCTLRAPHGGVFVVPLIGAPFLYLVAIAAGVAVATGSVVALKSLRGPVSGPETEAAGARVAA